MFENVFGKPRVNRSTVSAQINSYQSSVGTSAVLYSLVVEYFDPVAVRILDESDGFHLSVGQSLDELDAQFLEPFASLRDIGDHDPNVTEATGFRVSWEIRLS